MATLAQQNELRAAIASKDKTRIAAAEKAAMSNSGSERDVAGTTYARATGSTPPKDRSKDKPTLTTTLSASQKAAQDYIAKTNSGGLASYIQNQVNRWNASGNNTDLQNRLKDDAAKVGYSLPGLADNRSALEKYGGPSNDEEAKDLERYEKEMKETGNAVLPKYMQEKSGQYQENLMRKNADAFYNNINTYGNDNTKAVARNNQEVLKKTPSIVDVLGANSKSGYINTFVGDYRGWAPGDHLGDREATFNWQTGAVTGNAKLLDSNYDLAKDGSLAASQKARDQVFDAEYRKLVDSGQIPDDEETKNGFYSYKGAWDAKNTTENGYTGELNATLASVLANQKKAPATETPAPAPAATPAPAIELKLGSRGDDVKKLQQALGITADGIFGKQTAAALSAYQAKNGLPQSGRADGSTLAALQKSAQTTDTDNQVRYLNDLVAKGGGQAVWAKAELAKLGASPIQAASAPSTAPVTSPQTGGVDFYASATKALQDGDVAAAMEYMNKRAAKLEGLKALGPEELAAKGLNLASLEASQAQLQSLVDAAKAKLPTNDPVVLEDNIAKAMEAADGDVEKMYEEVKKIVDASGDIELKGILDYDEAENQAAAKLDPVYDNAWQDKREQLTEDQLVRGFFGQAPGATQMMEESDKIQNMRKSDIATLAQTLVGQSKDDAYRRATFEQSNVQAKLSNMLSLLQTRGQISQNKVANLTALLGLQNDKKAQETADKQLEATLFGTVDGKPTLAYQNMMKQWGYSDAEAARAAELFPLQKKEMELSLKAAQKALSGGGSDGAKTPVPYDPQFDVSAAALKALDFGLSYASNSLKDKPNPGAALVETTRREGERLYMERALPKDLYRAWLKDQGYDPDARNTGSAKY